MGEKYRRISNDSIRDLVLLIQQFSKNVYNQIPFKKKIPLVDYVDAPQELSGHRAIEKLYGSEAERAYDDFTKNNHEFLTDNDKEFKKRFLKDKGRGIDQYNRAQREAAAKANSVIDKKNEEIKQQNKLIKKHNNALADEVNQTVFKMEELATKLERARFNTTHDVFIDLLNGTYTSAPKSGTKTRVIITNKDYTLYPVNYGQDAFKMTLSSALDTNNDDEEGYQPDPSLGYKDSRIRCNIATFSGKVPAGSIGHDINMYLLYPGLEVKRKKNTPQEIEAQRVFTAKLIDKFRLEYLDEKKKSKGKTTKNIKEIRRHLKTCCKSYNKLKNESIKFDYREIINGSDNYTYTVEVKKVNDKNKNQTANQSDAKFDFKVLFMPFIAIGKMIKSLFKGKPYDDFAEPKHKRSHSHYSSSSEPKEGGSMKLSIPWGLIAAGLLVGTYFIMRNSHVEYLISDLVFNPFFLFKYEVPFFPEYAFYLLNNNDTLFWGYLLLLLEAVVGLILVVAYLLTYVLMAIIGLILCLVVAVWVILLYAVLVFGLATVITGIAIFICVKFYIEYEDSSKKASGVFNIIIAVLAYIAYIVVSFTVR